MAESLQGFGSEHGDNELRTILALHAIAVSEMAQGLCLLDLEYRVVLFNRRFVEILGLSPNLVRLGVSIRTILRDGEKKNNSTSSAYLDMWCEIEKLFSHGEPFRLYRRFSTDAVIALHFQPTKGDGWVLTCEELDANMSHGQELQDRNRLLDAALDHMAHGLCAFDDQMNLIVANRRYLEMYGLTCEDAKPGTPMIELMRGSIAHGIHHAGIDAEQMFDDLKMRLIENKEPQLLRHLANGQVVAVRHQPMVGGGWVGTYEDITERYRAQDNIAYVARHDTLTELPNRLMFGERMIEGLSHVAEKKKTMAVMCFDLDNFKAVNDSLGHPAGDKLLQELARRLCMVVGNSDTVARLGGDEFAIIYPGAGRSDVEELARRLINTTANPFLIDGRVIHSSICIGTAIAPEHGCTAEQLMKCADIALYRAKAQGRGTWRLFNPEMDAEIQARRVLEVDLHRALSAGEFHIDYQPLINLATNEVVGMEALVRWMHPERGPIPPAEFIPIAEESGLIVPLGEWVLRRACAEARNWPGTIRLAVNLSPVQFRNRTLVSVVINTLAAERLSAERLELEITEAALMQNEDSVLTMLRQLREMGVRIAMDDFGTGYSSLSYLRKFPLDRIKIDRSFIADSGSNADSAVIVRTISGLGQALGIDTTAEGIETAEQLKFVQQAGCTEGQGYFIGRPRAASETREFIAEFQRVGTAA